MIFYRGDKSTGQRADNIDLNLIAVIILLMAFGLIMLYSTTAYGQAMKGNSDLTVFGKQGIIALFSFALALGFSYVDYHIFFKLGATAYIVAILFIATVITPLGQNWNGATRWIMIGPVSVQPAEFAKVAVIVFIPAVIIKMGKRFRGFKATMVPLCLGLVLSAETYLLTSNMSTAIIIFGITAVIVFVAHPKTWPFIILVLILFALALLMVYIAKNSDLADSRFRFKRVLVWLNPELYSREEGYQILQALYALGSGGLFGKGLGNSTQKLGYVPEAGNDMIFSIVCEELGIFGGVIVLVLFGYLLYRLFYIAQNAKDLYGSLIATGIFAHFMLQVILNISVVLNIIPTTGITLPFISSGGTSVVFLMMEISLALMVSRQIPKKRMEKDLWGDVVSEYDY